MALEEYRRKRDFQKTAEPPPGPVKPRATHLSYLIQKHAATRLHYDFRLELDGVLLSWAVTKGPSLDPADKRLAVRTEDHPLSYGSFEGTIPKGEYGGGTVMLWDKGTWEPIGDAHEALRKGHLSFLLHGDRLKGRWALIRMRGRDTKDNRENWLLVKGEDEAANKEADGQFLDDLAFSVNSGRTMEQIAESNGPQWSSSEPLSKLIETYPEVQLATLVEEAPAGDKWIFEVKFDGYRLLGYVSGGKAVLRTRNGNDWTGRFPSLTAALQKLDVHDAVVDMEAVVLDGEGKSSFQALQAALGEGGDASHIVAYAFDLLELNSRDLRSLPLLERKEQLKKALGKQQWLRYSDHVVAQGAAMLEKACETGLEGIIAKEANAPYSTGRKGSWLKIKCHRRQEFVIVGYSDARSGGRALGALYLGYQKDGKLAYAGKAGTGFTMESARELTKRFAKLATDKPVLTKAEMKGIASPEWRSIHWVKPSLLGEVAFTEWTDDGRIRHPSFQGIREDKPAAEVKMETATAKSDGLVLKGVTITHPDRVISETGHVTKGELATYHAAVADLMLPHIVRRPISLLRCPSGIDADCFFQRNPGRGLGADIKPFEFHHKGNDYQYLYVEDAKGLLELIQMGVIELHPWGCTVDSIDYPDRMIFDLDPAPEVPWEAVKLAAQDLRQRLKKKGLEAGLKTTGGKGLHIIVPLDEKSTWPDVKAFAESVANEMVTDTPEAYIANMRKVKRTGKIFIDYFRNDYTATAIVEYGVRARPGAPVACPIEWRELNSVTSPSQFTIPEMMKRLKKKQPKLPGPQKLPG